MLHSIVHGKGVPLLVFHGLFGSADNWSTLGKRWGMWFEVHLVDLRNHGRSPHFPTHSYSEMAQDVLEYMDAHSLTSAHILGHSMGGKTAMELACTSPESVRSLLVADIGPWSYPVHHAAIIKALQDLNPSQYAQRKEAEMAFAQSGLDAGTRMFLLKNLYWEGESLAWRINLQALSQHIEEVGKPLPVQSRFSGPCLFLRGAQSSYIPKDAEPTLRQWFPNARLETISAAGHWLHADQPDLVFQAGFDFFSAVDAGLGGA